ncbi:MAG: hypothetical protein ACOYMG_23170, partial [Candidatus Methylumidiphilus sp.]
MATFHFDLHHIDNTQNQQTFLLIRGNKFILEAHDNASFEEIRNSNHGNKVLVLLAKRNEPTVSHFANVPDEFLPDGSLTLIQVVGQTNENDAENYLQPLYHIALKPSVSDHRRYWEKNLNKFATNVPPSLHYYGIESLPENDNPMDYFADDYGMQSPLDTACFLAGLHPMTMNIQPEVYNAMKSEHVYPVCKNADPDGINQINDMRRLARSIIKQGEKFSTIKPVVDGNGKKMTYGFDLGERKEGDVVLQRELSDETLSYLKIAASRPVQTSRNDPQFHKQTWTVVQGQSAENVANKKPPLKTNPADEIGNTDNTKSSNWRVSPNCSSHGISLDVSSIRYRKGNTFEVDVQNYFLRIVGAFVQFFSDKEMKQPIKNPKGWQEKSPFFGVYSFETESKKFVDIIPPVDSVLGIPFPFFPKKLSLVWPDEANSARLMFGGLGSHYWDQLAWPGLIETGIFQYGLPLFFMQLGGLVKDTQWYRGIIEDKEKLVSLIGVTLGAWGTTALPSQAMSSGTLRTPLFQFANCIAGILVHKGLEKLTLSIVRRIAIEEVLVAVPIAGWIYRIAAITLDAAQMAITTTETMTCPCVIEVDIKRRMTFKFTLKPDPKHGEASSPETAIWPAAAHHYLIIVNYQKSSD